MLSLQDILGTCYLAEDTGFKYKYELGQKEIDLVLSQLDMCIQKNGNLVDNDDEDDHEVFGNYTGGILNTNIKLQDYVDLKVIKKLVAEQKHLKSDGSLDMRRLLGKATKKYQNALIAQGTYSSPVAGDEAGSPTNPDSSEN